MVFGKRLLNDLRSASAVVALVCYGLATPVEIRAQTPTTDDGEPSTAQIVVRPTSVEVGPTVDGDVLNDLAYQYATPAHGFWQQAPYEGEPASEDTEIYVVYTTDTIYFGIVCYDEDPDGIIVASSRRDSSLVETDSFQLVLDTYLDHQSGYVFGTNPVGIQYDGQVTREGQGGGFISSGGFNINWDGDWEVKSQITEIGWSTEIAIPFRTIRFPKHAEQTWGVNFQRNIRRRNEQSFWAPIPRQFNLFRVSLAGKMVGVGAPRQNNLKVLPYVLGIAYKEKGDEPTSDEDGEVGVDVKYSITPSLTADATINTDFAQVEVDELQVNLDRFNLFFPEKRPFFLENAGYFAVGVAEEIELFYSRRIGLGEEGELVPINWGGRMSGKAKDRYNVGLLYTQTGAVEDVAPKNRFGVARLSRDLGNRSSIGGLVTNRKSSDPAATEDDDNWTYSLDGRWGIKEDGLIQGFVAQTKTPGLEGDDHAFRLGGSWDTEKWSLAGNYTEVADNFNPEVGFLARKGYRKPDAFILRRIRPENLWGLLEIRPHVSYRGFWTFDDFQETGFLHLDTHWEWRNGYEIHTGVNSTREGLEDPFEISPGVTVPPGTYDNWEGQIVFHTNQGAPVSFSMRTTAGGFFDGDRFAFSPTLRFRIGDTFNTEIGWRYNDIDLEDGAFETNLGLLRASYSFTPKIFVQALVQYSDRDDIWATNLRFAWLTRASAGLYVVYNEIQEIDGTGTAIPGRSITIKYSHLFDVLK